MFRQYILTFFRVLQVFMDVNSVCGNLSQMFGTLDTGKGKGKDKGKAYARTGHEDKEGSRGLTVVFL